MQLENGRYVFNGQKFPFFFNFYINKFLFDSNLQGIAKYYHFLGLSSKSYIATGSLAYFEYQCLIFQSVAEYLSYIPC